MNQAELGTEVVGLTFAFDTKASQEDNSERIFRGFTAINIFIST